MSRYRSYLQVAKEIIKAYRGEVPFAVHLKKFFSGKKKFGSTDRKTIHAFCYNYFRAGNALKGSLDEKIIQSFFLLHAAPHPFFNELNPELYQHSSLTIGEKMKLLEIDPLLLFTWREHLSKEIESLPFCSSFLKQPALFLRLRPGKSRAVINKLEAAGIDFKRLDENSLRLAPGTKLDQIAIVNKEAVIQDLNSQHTLDFINKELFPILPANVWDCCAASGGKSILAYDKLEKQLRLTVTDIRSSILKNLSIRLAEARVPVYHSAVKDLIKPVDLGKFELIICDAPCTGSGTWARTPEQLHYFKEENIRYYSNLQKQIIGNVLPHLQPGGLFVYITCSVFAEENEEAVKFILHHHPGIELLHSEYIKGYCSDSDSLFTSTFRLPL